MTLQVLLAVLASTFMHALWNFTARRVKGDLAVIWVGLCIASVCMFPIAILSGPIGPQFLEAWPFMAATGIIHAFYFATLAICYRHGDISIVYPIARGTGVAGAALVAFFVLHEEISALGWVAFLAICLGTALLGYSEHASKGSIGTSLKAVLVGGIITAYSLVDKLGVGSAHPVVYIFALFFISAVCLTPLVLLKHKKQLHKVFHGSIRYSVIIGLGSMLTSL